jgi:hypothetical protein
VPSDEFLACRTRRGADRTPEHRPHAELRLEAPSSSGCLQGPDVNAEFFGQRGEWHELPTLGVLGEDLTGSTHDVRGRTT